MWAITGTVDHALTENLIVKAEVRYDVAKQKGAPDNFFLDGGNGGPTDWDDNDQVLGLVRIPGQHDRVPQQGAQPRVGELLVRHCTSRCPALLTGTGHRNIAPTPISRSVNICHGTPPGAACDLRVL